MSTCQQQRLKRYHEEVVLSANPEGGLPPPQENQQLIDAYGGFNKKCKVRGLGSVGKAAKVLLRGGSSRYSSTTSPTTGFVRVDQYEEVHRRTIQLEKERDEMMKRLEAQDLQIASMKQLVEKINSSWMNFVAPSQPMPPSQCPRAPSPLAAPQFQHPAVPNIGMQPPHLQMTQENISSFVNMFQTLQGGCLFPPNGFQQLLHQGTMPSPRLHTPQPHRSRPEIDLDTLIRFETNTLPRSAEDSTEGGSNDDYVN